jgi:hypothetical protein
VLGPVFIIPLPPGCFSSRQQQRDTVRGHFRLACEDGAALLIIVCYAHRDFLKPPTAKKKPRTNRQFVKLHALPLCFSLWSSLLVIVNDIFVDDSTARRGAQHDVNIVKLVRLICGPDSWPQPARSHCKAPAQLANPANTNPTPSLRQGDLAARHTKVDGSCN